MKNIIIMSIVTILMSASPALSLQESLMMDRPEELLELAEKLTMNIQSAEKTRDEILMEIDKRSERLKQIDEKLHNTGFSKSEKLKLKAQKNRLEREENGYRRQALGVVKTQMDNVFWSLEDMRKKMVDLRDQETMVDPRVVETFNKYFQVSAELIKNGMRGLHGTDAKTFYMIETLEKSLIVSQKSSDFLEKAINRIREYQKIVALYNAKLSYLDIGLEKHKNSLTHEKDAITIRVTLETAEGFMDGLNIGNMEKAFMDGLSRDPDEDLIGDESRSITQRFTSPQSLETIMRYINGNAIQQDY